MTGLLGAPSTTLVNANRKDRVRGYREGIDNFNLLVEALTSEYQACCSQHLVF
ncbi:hypothetical protein HQP04_21110 [Rhodococcus fascians]|nr:hypothetical protein [Rhodococcus fascians]MBY4024527.1 hypothetical protein [Rhodococcus fascians]